MMMARIKSPPQCETRLIHFPSFLRIEIYYNDYCYSRGCSLRNHQKLQSRRISRPKSRTRGTHHVIRPITIPCMRIRELSRRTSTALFNASNLGSATRPAHVTCLGCVAAVRASYDRKVLILLKIIVITASSSRLTILLTVAMYRKGEASKLTS